MERDWRCAGCNKRLGVLEGRRLRIRLARGHEFLVGFPVTAVCRTCKALNELRDPEEATAATVVDVQ